MRRIVYDVETIKNFFSLSWLDYDTGEKGVFEISFRKDDTRKLIEFFKDVKYIIGFNNKTFDNPILFNILDNGLKFPNGKSLAAFCYKMAQDIIASQNEEEPHPYFNYVYDKRFKSIDLFAFWSKMLRKSKKLSLKYFAHNLNMDIWEMPVPHNRDIDDEEADLVIAYNFNDIEVTCELAKKLKEGINLRIWIQKEYGLDCLSWDSPKIASEILLDDFCKKTYLPGEETFSQYKKRIKNQKYYLEKPFRNGDFVPKIEFKTKQFQDLYQEICNSYNGFTKEVLMKQADGSYLKISYGSGGIHTVNTNENYVTTSESDVYTSDVASLYPNLLINYEFIRKDLLPVLEKYKEVKEERIEAKKTKNETKDAFLKLILNALTGLLDNTPSWLYSPEYIMGLRLTGQLLLTRLTEECVLNSLIIRSLNTDGIEIIVPKEKEKLYLEIISKIEKEFNVAFEHYIYKFINYSSVNDYIAETSSGKIKVKGSFIYEKVLDGSNEFLIIPLAIKEYLTKGIPIEETIKNHENIYDFCSAKKNDKKFTTYYKGEAVQRLNRYFVSDRINGSYLYKSKDGIKMENMLKNTPIVLLNEMTEKKAQEFPVNYSYYINKAQEILDNFYPSQLTLF